MSLTETPEVQTTTRSTRPRTPRSTAERTRKLALDEAEEMLAAGKDLKLVFEYLAASLAIDELLSLVDSMTGHEPEVTRAALESLRSSAHATAHTSSVITGALTGKKREALTTDQAIARVKRFGGRVREMRALLPDEPAQGHAKPRTTRLLMAPTSDTPASSAG